MVDNASTDGSRRPRRGGSRRSYDSIRVLASPVNRGYAGAVNLALEEARGAYVAVLNMDITVERRLARTRWSPSSRRTRAPARSAR